MGQQAHSLNRWLAALALMLPAVLVFNGFVFGTVGALVVPVAVFGAATGTGYARRDAFALGAGSAVLAAIGGIYASNFAAAPLVVYAIVTVAAVRPASLRTAGYRFATVVAAVLAAQHWHAWWAALFIPALAAASDEVVDRFGGGLRVESPPAEETRQGRPAAGPALMLASLSCFLLLGIPLLSSDNSLFVLVVVGFASAVGGAGLALWTAHADTARAAAALVLSTLPVIVWGWLLLIFLSGGLEIVS
jgi:hypothetical protein